MNPILLGRECADALKDRVRKSFVMSSPAFAGTIDRFLEEKPETVDEDGKRRRRKANFLQGPFISVDLPFRPAEDAEPFPEVPLGFHPFAHQAKAFERLRAPAPRSTLVATGTGSGKTECYLWPILDACRARRGEKGIKAIIIYPMNALASDQARRIAKAIATIPALSGVRCGIYADAEPRDAKGEMQPDSVITSRKAMQDDPPDILLTNYKMLDLLLLRPADQALWIRNAATTLSYLVVDELHTFDGAQGADLALLIRRLKSRLGAPAGHLACIGSSATLGTGPGARDKLRTYAENIFGETFDEESVVGEDRLKVAELFPLRDEDQVFDAVPAPGRVADTLDAAAGMTQPAAAEALAALFFPHLNPRLLGAGQRDPAGEGWRILLGLALKQHFAVKRLLAALAERKGPSTLAEIAASLERSGARFPQHETADLARLAEALVSLISWARDEKPEGSTRDARPLFPVRVQYWAREMGRMAATLPHPNGDEPGRINLVHSQDVDPERLKRMLPVVHCSQCGTTGHVGVTSLRTASLWAPLKEIYGSYFDGATDRLRFIYHEPVQPAGKGSGTARVVEGMLQRDLSFRAKHEGCDDPEAIRVHLYNPVDAKGRLDTTCPGCAAPAALQLLGLRAARLTATLATTLFSSQHNEVEDEAKPRLLLFSDSVQDAAQRAAVAEMRNAADVLRQTLRREVEAAPNRTRTLAAITEELPAELRAALGDQAFVARHIAHDQTWREGYRALTEKGEAPDGLLCEHVKLRLGWDLFVDLTYMAHGSRTLETARLVVAEVDPAAVDAVAERLARSPDLAASRISLDLEQARAFVSGLFRHMRRRGAVGHAYVVGAVENADARGLGWFAAAQQLGVGRTAALPTPRLQVSGAPLPPTLRDSAAGFETMVGKGARWYAAWANRTLLDALGGSLDALDAQRVANLYTAAMRAAEAERVVLAVSSSKRIGAAPPVRGYLLNPGRVLVSAEVAVVGCDVCARRDTVLDASLSQFPRPCSRIGCSGSMAPVTDRSGGAVPGPRLHRVVAREHTGVVETETRRALERDFIGGEAPWNPNLVSATPTLEMGIDIGDLSTVLLCQVPPEAANYVQRIGRTGRRDGNSVNLTLVAARPHDLEYWELPWAMLGGEVTPPGVHLKAEAVLRRQASAYVLDRHAAQRGPSAPAYGKVRGVLGALDAGGGAFLAGIFELLERDGHMIARDFIALLPGSETSLELADGITAYIAGDGEASLRSDLRRVFEDARDERDAQVALQLEIDKERDRLRRLSPAPKDLDEQIVKLKLEREQIGVSIRVGILDVDVLQFVTDRGLLPNYAFPEQGTKLKSIIVRRREGSGEPKPMIEEFVRPASSALGEFAPFQTFYANGRGVTVSRIDIGRGDLVQWRFCPRCAHNDRAGPVVEPQCPRCGAEGWADQGALASVVTLRTATAVTSEERAAIRELDDRQASQHDRAMFPSHRPEAVRFAFSADDASGPPFGFEFIDRCELREVNFGGQSQFPGQAVAGAQRMSEPFTMCRKCGSLQRRPRRDAGPGDDHARSCLALRKAEDAIEWESRIYLMRAFVTEAVRVVLPVTRQADANEIKSFVAAIELGMRAHFEGRIDHLRSTVVEETLGAEAKLRSLYLYDSVPGGSGYLRELVESPDKMRRVFEKARDLIADCRCGDDDERNGCYRCVRGYRAQFGPGEPRRDVALAFVEAVLDGWDRLKRTERIDDQIRDRVVESELEKRFLDALSERFGAAALKQKFIAGTRRAYQLSIRGPAGPIHWDVEAQVDIEREQPGLPRRRVDFLLRPRGGPGKPIVVELDGWETHAATVARDVEQRLQIIRTGKLAVWTLTWDDFGPEAATLPNPLGRALLGAEFENTLDRFWRSPIGAPFCEYRPTVEALCDPEKTSLSSAGEDRVGSSLGALFHRLSMPAPIGPVPAAVFLRLATGRGTSLDSATADLDANNRSFVADAELFARFEDGSVRVITGVPRSAPDPAATRAVIAADIPEAASPDERALRPPWRGFWRLFNFLQDLPGFHASVPGQTVGAPNLGEDYCAAWSLDPHDAEFLDKPVLAVLRALSEAGAPPPDRIGDELMNGDAVAGQAEAVWSQARVALVREEFAIEGWTLIQLENHEDAPTRLPTDALLEALKVAA